MLPEIDQYLTRIEDLHSQVAASIRDQSTEALNWRPIEGTGDMATNSLAVLVVHIAGAQHFWIGEVVGNLPSTRDRDAEFAYIAESPHVPLEKLELAARETRQILTKLSSADLDGSRQVRDKTIPVRWAILHVIDHTSLHWGHMQLTYQLWNHGKSTPSPLWFQRLKDQD